MHANPTQFKIQRRSSDLTDPAFEALELQYLDILYEQRSRYLSLV